MDYNRIVHVYVGSYFPNSMIEFTENIQENKIMPFGLNGITSFNVRLRVSN